MITKEDLEKRYSKLSKSELMDIIENKFEYTELAVSVAFEEIAKRNITEEDVKKFKNKKIEEVEKAIKQNIADDLSFFQKNIFFYLWFPFVNFLFKRRFFEDGYALKLKQANYYSRLGFFFCILDIIAQLQINYSNFVFWTVWISTFPIAFLFDEYFNRQSQIRKLNNLLQKKG